MKRMKWFFIAAVIALFPFICTGKEANAEVCAPGHYSEQLADGTFKCTDKGVIPDSDLNQINQMVSYINNFAKSLSGLSLGIGAVMIVVGGIWYAVSEGDPKRTRQAKMILLCSAAGIFVDFMSFVIVELIKP